MGRYEGSGIEGVARTLCRGGQIVHQNRRSHGEEEVPSAGASELINMQSIGVCYAFPTNTRHSVVLRDQERARDCDGLLSGCGCEGCSGLVAGDRKNVRFPRLLDGSCDGEGVEEKNGALQPRRKTS